jgi:S1-C subfamily serine protease
MASFGVVSTVGGAWRTFRGAQVDGYIRSDTTFFPGFSGGPLVTVAGQVAGINSSRLWRGSGLTIPVAATAPIVDALLAGGRLRRGYLGIGSQATRLPEALAAKAGGQASGLLIVGVEPESPADAAGLLVGDILVRMGDTQLTDTDDLQAALGPSSVGQAVAVAVLRGGEPQTLTVTVGERR